MAKMHIGHAGREGGPGTLRQLHRHRKRLAGRKAGRNRKGYGRALSGRRGGRR